MFMSFPDPHRAIDACLDAQRSFARFDIGDGRVLRVRMGVHSGPAVVDPVEGYVGLTVHEAARIMTAAHGGQVLLSADTASLVPSVSTWNLGPFLLKDIEGPVELHQLRHDDLQTNFPAVRARAAGRRAFPDELAAEVFVGRTLELQWLQESWHQARSGFLSAVLVGGEAGIGKTSLVGRLAAGVYAEGATVLYGRSRKGLAVPYQSFGEALSRWATNTSDEELAPVVERWGPHLSGFLPELTDRFGVKASPPSSETAQLRLHQLQAMSALLASAADAAPLLLVLDDMQWADASSVHLLDELMRRGGALAALVVVAFRDTDVEPDSPFDAALAALGLTSHVRSISLTGLNPHETAELTLRRSQDGQTLHRLTGGNPFLLRQMLSTDGMADQSLPVADLVATRSASLRGPAKSVLSFAAVVGSEFGLDVLTHVTGRTIAELLEVVEECTRAQLVDETGPGRFRFRHDLVWEVLYADLSASRRALYHGLIGDALEREPAMELPTPELAYHFTRALDPQRKSKGVDYAMAAGNLASRRLAFEAAIEAFDLGLATLDRLTQDDLARRMDLLYERGRACLGAGAAHWESGQADLWHVVDLAEANADALQAARAVIELSENTLTAGGDARLADQQLRCLARLEVFADDAAAGAQRALLLAARGRYLAHSEGRGVTGRALTDEAVQLARRLDSPVVLRHALSAHLGSCIGEPIADRVTWIAELEELAGVTGSEWDKKIARHHRAVLAAEHADAAAVHDAVARCDELRFEAFAALAFEHLDTAENAVLKAIEEARHGEAMGQLGIVLWWKDRVEVTISSYETLLAMQPDLEAARAGLALVLATSGHRAHALSALEVLAPEDTLRLRDDAYALGVLALITESAFALDHAALATQLRAQLFAYSGRLVTLRYVAVLGSADRYLAMCHALLGEFEDAFAAFEHALALERRFGSATLASQSDLAYASALARGGRTRDARRHAETAQHAGNEKGVAFVVRRASELLSTLG